MTQAIDFRFEALFLLLLLTSLVLLLTAVVLKIRAHGSVARRLLTALGIGWCVYLSIVFAVAAATPQIIVNPREDLCFDDMCFAVTNVQTAARLGPGVQSNGTFYVVTVRVKNRARGRAMKENGICAVIRAAHGTYPVSPVGQAAWDRQHPGNFPLGFFYSRTRTSSVIRCLTSRGQLAILAWSSATGSHRGTSSSVSAPFSTDRQSFGYLRSIERPPLLASIAGPLESVRADAAAKSTVGT
jgi:hypothetical protein